MDKSEFNPSYQQGDTASKIVAGLERLSEVFKVLLWDKAKEVGLSPIQIQILIFVAFHKPVLCNVSHLAKEFNVTKPTISDAIKVLDKKGLIVKDYSSPDSRSYTIMLSDQGKEMVAETNDFARPLKAQVDNLDDSELTQLFDTLGRLIYKLHQHGVLEVQRICYGCKFYELNGQGHYCNLLKTSLLKEAIRVDCPEYEEKG